MTDSTLDLNVNDSFKQQTYPVIRDKLNQILGDGQLDAEDDTLLDYVTLLVSNKRTGAQVAQELETFTGADTEPFVRWLWEFLSPFCIRPAAPTPVAVQLPAKAPPEQQQARRLSTVVVQPEVSKPATRERSLRKTSSDLLPMKGVLSRAVKEAAADSERRQERGRGRDKKRAPQHAPDREAAAPNRSRVRERSVSPKAGARTGKGRNSETRELYTARSSRARMERRRHTDENMRGREAQQPVERPAGVREQPIPARRKRERTRLADSGRKVENEPDHDAGSAQVAKKRKSVRITIDNKSATPSLESTKYTRPGLVAGGNETSSPSAPKAAAAAPTRPRCTFWPKCDKGDACAFEHPTETCKFWPRCTFGSRCMYVHPKTATTTTAAAAAAAATTGPHSLASAKPLTSAPCRYGTACFRSDCKFSHPGGRAATGAKKGLCRFDLRCTKINCEFQHPKRDSSGYFASDLDDDEVDVKISHSLPKTPPHLVV